MYQPLAAYNRLTRAPRSEFHNVALTLESGVVPRDLVGSLYRNGPGSLESFGVPYEHLFDGDGYVQRFAFDGDTVRYTARFVRTEEFVAEQAAGRPLYRSFGTNLPGGVRRNLLRFHFKNAANTSLLPMGDHLLTLWEGGSPYRVDRRTLDTVPGRWSNGGLLAPRGPIEEKMGVGRPFSAHPKHLAARGEILNFGMLPGTRQRVLLHRLPAADDGSIATGGPEPLGAVTELVLPKLTFAHDFVVLDDGRRVMFDVPVAFNLLPTFFGLRSPVAGIGEDRRRPTVVRIIDDRTPGSAPTQQTAETDPLYVFHFPNGYRRDDGTIVADACRMDHFPGAADIRMLMQGIEPDRPFSARLTRFEIDPASGSTRATEMSDYPMELPAINPRFRAREYRYVWGVADRPDRGHAAALHGIARFDLETGAVDFVDFYPGFAGEPLFVPRRPAENTASGATEPDPAGEDDGWLLVLSVDVEAGVSRLHIFSADTMEEAARLRLPHAVHVGFHGVWLPDDPNTLLN